MNPAAICAPTPAVAIAPAGAPGPGRVGAARQCTAAAAGMSAWRARSRHEDIIEDHPAGRPGPAGHIDQTVTARDVRAAIATLTPGHRQIVVEMFYHGRRVDEIAESLGIPAATVKWRAYYALRHLKRHLAAPGTDTGQSGSAHLRVQGRQA